jgi:hypothetical protein
MGAAGAAWTSATTGAASTGSWISGDGASTGSGAAGAIGAAAIGTTAGSGASTTEVAAAGGAAGFTVFTRRGGGSAGAVGFGGSGAFLLGAAFPAFGAGVSAKISPGGSEMFRCRASRSTNCRATTSSIVLDALLTSIPWSRFRSAVTSWLVVPRSSATL